MYSFFLTLTLCIYCRRCFVNGQDWSAFDSTEGALGGNSDLILPDTSYDNDFWDSSSPFSVSSDDDLLLVDSSACGSLSSPLGRRGGETCPNETPPIQKPIIELRPLGTTNDPRLLPMKSNYYLCLPDLMGYSRNYVICDSGSDDDRHSTSEPGIFDLTNCDICTSRPYFFDPICADPSAVDILYGCFTPRQVWCCEKVKFQTTADQRVGLIDSCQSYALS